MSFTDKLDALMADKGINKSILSKESGIPVSYTHLDVYKRQTLIRNKFNAIRITLSCSYFSV